VNCPGCKLPKLTTRCGGCGRCQDCGCACPGAGFVKHDVGKVRFGLVPFDALREIAHVLTTGAAKYSDHNWKAGADWSRYFDALMRHLTAWWEGESLDAETGRSHLAHAGCCLLFLLAYELRGIGKDDRPCVR
jgi:hypothetical protein